MPDLPAPFKCVGGKGKLVGALRELLPPKEEWSEGYCEPFVGGGALFRHLAGTASLPDKVWLNDASPGTARTWQDLKRNGRWTEDWLLKRELQYARATPEERKALYDKERAVWNSGGVTGARHIFLRKTGFNGLWRENKKGEYNVPWGKYKTFAAPRLKPLVEALSAHQVEVTNLSGADVVGQVGCGWLVYVDPPYLGEFSNYTSAGFNASDHVRLIQACAGAADRGVKVLYSNRWCPEVLELLQQHWPEANRQRLVVQQTVACTNTGRGAVEELVAYG